MEDRDAFSIEKHTLKVTQPLEPAGENIQRIDCPSDEGRRFGRIGFSKGFSDWWFLSQIDVKVPLEHTHQEVFCGGSNDTFLLGHWRSGRCG